MRTAVDVSRFHSGVVVGEGGGGDGLEAAVPVPVALVVALVVAGLWRGGGSGGVPW